MWAYHHKQQTTSHYEWHIFMTSNYFHSHLIKFWCDHYLGVTTCENTYNEQLSTDRYSYSIEYSDQVITSYTVYEVNLSW